MLQKITSLFRRKKKENIIFIALDGVRLDQFRSSPQFSKYLRQGTLFSTMITYSPHSITSFHAIFTGVYGSKSGVDSYFGTPQFKKEQVKTLPQYLQEEGYYCIGDSMNELVIPSQGFHKLIIQKEFTEFIQDHRQILDQVVEKNKEGTPCFVHLHCSYLHNDVVQGVIKKFKGRETEYYQKRAENEARYQQYLTKIDRYVQIIGTELEKKNLFEDSVVIFFSDHGNSLGEKEGEVAYGNLCYDYSLKTFALWLKKGSFPEQEISQMIRNVDLLPTILEYLHLKADKSKIPLDGASVLNLIKEKKGAERISFSETGGMTGPCPSPKSPNVFTVRTDRWKLIYLQDLQKYEMYDLLHDPPEEHNLIGQEKPEETMLRTLLQEYRSTGSKNPESKNQNL